ASKSNDKIITLVTAAIIEGLSDRGSDKEGDATTEVAAPAAEAVEVAPAVEAAAPTATEE
ncbi:MAG: 30S ribosomal protein S2, partial [Flavobacterium sp.]